MIDVYPCLSQMSDDLVFFSFVFLDRLSATSSHSSKVGEKKKKKINLFFLLIAKRYSSRGGSCVGWNLELKTKTVFIFSFFLSKASGRV